jgi:hypothetical protein
VPQAVDATVLKLRSKGAGGGPLPRRGQGRDVTDEAYARFKAL